MAGILDLLNSDLGKTLISGASKQAVLQAAQAGEDIAELPIRAVLNQQAAPLSIYWAK